MPRDRNTDVKGRPFDEQTINDVWEKAREDPGRPGVRIDVCGAPMLRNSYGNKEEFGWEIDHITPVSKDGNDRLTNLQPLQWENNREKGDADPEVWEGFRRR